MIYITRREHFNAAHRVFVEGWSDQKNYQHFGACSNPNWHGHNYELFVVVKGEPDPVSGYVMDLKILSRLIKTKVLGKVDHKNLNLEVDFMQGIQPSTENIAKAIYHELAPEIANEGAILHAIRLHETENNSVEYFGE
ncbi:6-pyruvoyl tetrahydropterin synthase family protein [Bacteroidota bacterium]